MGVRGRVRVCVCLCVCVHTCSVCGSQRRMSARPRERVYSGCKTSASMRAMVGVRAHSMVGAARMNSSATIQDTHSAGGTHSRRERNERTRGNSESRDTDAQEGGQKRTYAHPRRGALGPAMLPRGRTRMGSHDRLVATADGPQLPTALKPEAVKTRRLVVCMLAVLSILS